MPDKKTHLPYERWQYDPDNETTDPIEGQSSTLIETPDIHTVSVQKQLLHPVSKFLNTQVKPAIDALRGNSKTDFVQSYESDFWVQAANVRGRPSPPVRKGPTPAPAKAPPPAAVKDNKPAPSPDKKEPKPPKAPKVPKPPKQDFTDWNPTENVSFPVEQKDLDWFRRCLRKGIYISCILHLVIFLLTLIFTATAMSAQGLFKKLSYGVFTLLILMMFVYLSYTTLLFFGTRKVDLLYLVAAEMLISVKFVIELAVSVSGLTYVSYRAIEYPERIRPYTVVREWYEEYYPLDTFLIIFFILLLIYCIFGQFRETSLLGCYMAVVTSDPLTKSIVARALFFTANCGKIKLAVTPPKSSPA